MQKNKKGVLAKTFAFVLACSLIGIPAPDANAAKKPKLSAKKITVTIKKSKKIKIKNVKAKKVKKLTVKSSRKKIATVKKNGKTAFKVTGKKAGKAVVTAKITLKGKKKAITLKLNVTVKNDNVTIPKNSPTPEPVVTPTATPSAAPSATPVPSLSPTPSPTPDNKRITGKSDIADPIINNISIWGMQDSPYAEVGYDYRQYGTYSGILSKWFEAKDSFKAISELFNPQTAQSLAAKQAPSLMAAADTGEEPDPVGTKDSAVKSTLQTGKLNYTTKEESDVQNHVIDFEIRTGLSNIDNQKVEVVDDPAGGDDTAVLVTGRTTGWHGIQFDVTDFVKDTTKDYRISMEVYHKDTSANSKQFYIQTEYKDANDEHLILSGLDEYPTLCMAASPANQWKSFSATYSSKNTEAAAKTLLYINWYQNNTGDYYIKNLKIMEIESDKTTDPSEVLSMDPLYTNTEKNYGFSLGGVIGTGSFQDENYRAVINRHFSSLTIDNPLKMYSMLDQEATQANSEANGGDGMPVLRKDGDGEKIVAWAHENGIGVRGHTIVCDTAMNTNCPYFFHEDYDIDKPLASQEVMKKRLESFITQCITYFEEKYPGTIYTWDVVNEAIETDSRGYEKGDARKIQIGEVGSDGKISSPNLFYSTIGKDYVEYSFLYARKAVNELKAKYPDRNIDIQLFYNDYNCYESSKRNAIVALIQSIQAFGQSNNMGNLIDGIGMQCYLGTVGDGADKLSDELLKTSTKRSTSSIPNAVFMFHDLGCKVQFTELTIRNYDESQNTAQAEYYKKFLQMAIDINNGTMEKALQ